jgi:hypothetical protein
MYPFKAFVEALIPWFITSTAMVFISFPNTESAILGSKPEDLNSGLSWTSTFYYFS